MRMRQKSYPKQLVGLLTQVGQSYGHKRKDQQGIIKFKNVLNNVEK